MTDVRRLLELVYPKHEVDRIIREMNDAWRQYKSFSFKKQRVTKREFEKKYVKRILWEDGFRELIKYV